MHGHLRLFSPAALRPALPLSPHYLDWSTRAIEIL